MREGVGLVEEKIFFHALLLPPRMTEPLRQLILHFHNKIRLHRRPFSLQITDGQILDCTWFWAIALISIKANILTSYADC